MYCLIQLYVPLSPLLAPYKPLTKLFAVKAVGMSSLLSPQFWHGLMVVVRIVFLTFWQATLLGGLATIGIVKDVSLSPTLLLILLELTLRWDNRRRI